MINFYMGTNQNTILHIFLMSNDHMILLCIYPHNLMYNYHHIYILYYLNLFYLERIV